MKGTTATAGAYQTLASDPGATTTTRIEPAAVPEANLGGAATMAMPMNELLSEELDRLPLSSDDSELHVFGNAYKALKCGKFQEIINLFGKCVCVDPLFHYTR